MPPKKMGKLQFMSYFFCIYLEIKKIVYLNHRYERVTWILAHLLQEEVKPCNMSSGLW